MVAETDVQLEFQLNADSLSSCGANMGSNPIKGVPLDAELFSAVLGNTPAGCYAFKHKCRKAGRVSLNIGNLNLASVDLEELPGLADLRHRMVCIGQRHTEQLCLLDADDVPGKTRKKKEKAIERPRSSRTRSAAPTSDCKGGPSATGLFLQSQRPVHALLARRQKKDVCPWTFILLSLEVGKLEFGIWNLEFREPADLFRFPAAHDGHCAFNENAPAKFTLSSEQTPGCVPSDLGSVIGGETGVEIQREKSNAFTLSEPSCSRTSSVKKH
ncbi:hypothetical protein C8R47DRAFT_1078835 [Mycena vitilis]|nr:hypothetical protein C8R47DRAFT_1078835 [Mycena vitilis]